MRRLVPVLILALVVGGLVGGLIARDPGYVLVIYERTSFETSLWAALLLLVAAYLAVRLVLRLIGFSTHAGEHWRQWGAERRRRHARALLEQGLMFEAEGRWSEEKKALMRAVEASDAPLVNYLHAARAAHELGDDEERDRLLERALEVAPGAAFTVGLTRARLELARQQYERALATLLELRRRAPRNPALLRMLAESYLRLGDWQALLALIPQLRRHDALSETELRELVERAWQERLREISARVDADDVSALDAAWRELPKDLRNDPRLVMHHARALDRLGAAGQAEALLRSAIEQRWEDELVALYGELRMAHDDQALRERRRATAEAWRRQRGDDPVLLLTLGRILMAQDEPAQARDHLEASLRIEPSPQCHAALGELHQRLGEYRSAAEHFAKALPDRVDGEAQAKPALPA